MQEKVAIVDDEPSLRRALKRLVEAGGFPTQVYGSGEELLGDSLDGVACAILDVNLGGMSGIDAGRRLASKHDEISVIFITASDSCDIRKKAMEVGCSAFLLKPFRGDVLVRAVREVMHSHV
jgi:FixJ family two-component response regulator